MYKNNMEKKVFIWIIYSPLREDKAGTQSLLKPEEDADAEALEESCLLACS